MVEVDRERYAQRRNAGYPTSASELLELDGVPPHVDILQFDAPAEQLFGYEGLQSLVSLNLSRLGITDKEVVTLAQSPYLGKLKWLSLAGNPKISQAGVEAICQAGIEGRLGLYWLDLEATDFEVTPYLDEINDDTTFWRVPLDTHVLIKKYGSQPWMTMGRSLAQANQEIIPNDNYPPDRFNLELLMGDPALNDEERLDRLT